MGYGYNNYAYGHTAGLGIAGGLLSLLFWILIIVLVGILIRRVLWHGHMHHDGYHNRGGQALEILKERYAKGELTKEEFDSKKKDLM